MIRQSDIRPLRSVGPLSVNASLSDFINAEMGKQFCEINLSTNPSISLLCFSVMSFNVHYISFPKEILIKFYRTQLEYVQ